MEIYLWKLQEIIKKKFNVSKIYLVGYSWGTRIGTIAAARYPELFHAYIAVGLAADSKESDLIGYHFTVNTAKRLRDHYMVPSVVAEKFYNQLQAPKGKKLIWFENAAHTANMDEPQKFYDVVVNVVLKETHMD